MSRAIHEMDNLETGFAKLLHLNNVVHTHFREISEALSRSVINSIVIAFTRDLTNLHLFVIHPWHSKDSGPVQAR